LQDDGPHDAQHRHRRYEFFIRFSPRGYALGVNAVLYALTH